MLSEFGSRSDWNGIQERMFRQFKHLGMQSINEYPTLSCKSRCEREASPSIIFLEITRDSYASPSLSLSLSTTCFQSLQIIWIQKIADVLPNQIRGKQAYQELIMLANVRLCIRCLERIKLSRDMRFPTISKASDQPAHMHSQIRAFASRLNILYEC